MESIDISRLKELQPQEFQELASDPLKMAGIWESSEEGTKQFHEQHQQAQKNLETARECEESIRVNEKLRSELAEASKTLHLRHDDWQVAESEMYSALEPMSSQGVKNRLKWALSESEDVCKALEQSWKPEDNLQAFVNEYQQQAALKHMRKLKVDSIS